MADQETADLSHYASLVSAQASSALSGLDAQALPAALGAPPDEATLSLAAPAAQLRLAWKSDLAPDLVACLNALAKLGQHHAHHDATRQRAPRLANPFGHRRPAYFHLALHLNLAAFRDRYEDLPTSLWGACEAALADAVAPARLVEAWADVPPPDESVADALWMALCLAEYALAAGRDADLELTDSVVHQALSKPGPRGSLHPQPHDESLDFWTYHELVGLHALANLALLRRRRNWAVRVREIAEHHLNHTQPDFTTTEPWGVFAFVWNAETRIFADQQLSDAGGQAITPGGRLLPGLLLADAAACLRQFA